MIKIQEISRPDSCLNRADDYEPVFVLRANDFTAPDAIRAWAGNYVISKLRAQHGELTTDQWNKVREALNVADQMEIWKNDYNKIEGFAGGT